MCIRVVVGLVALAVGLLAGTQRSDAGSRHAGPRLDFEIFSVGLDGRPKRNLTHNAANDYWPALSPDGRRIAFVRGAQDASQSGIWLMNSDGSGQRKIPGTDECVRPVWSPDGTRIALVSHDWSLADGDQWSVVVLSVADGRLTTIDDAANPTWAPGGERLAFLSDPIPSFRAGWRALSVADPDGADRKVVFRSDGGLSFAPVWSTHGSLIALTVHGYGHLPLHLVDALSGEERMVARDGWHPAWSPGGGRVAFGNYGGISLIRVARPGTHKLVGVGDDSIAPRDPRWSPDGRAIAFITKRRVRVVHVAGERVQLVARSKGQLTAPIWAQSGRRLYFAARLGG